MRRKRTRHRHAAALATLLAQTGVGCGQPREATRSPVVEAVRGDPSIALARLLAADAVYHDKFARRTLYSWTTAEQIDELRKTRRVLVRDESPVNGASYVDQVLYVLSLRGDPVAQKIYTTPFARMRFAWPSMWATRAGWPAEQYGDQLIRITLKPDAWIAYLSTATGAFVIHDLKDEVVPQDAVLAKPERIAAIYFVSDASVPAAAGIPRPASSFREYALCNESMIEWYEVGTARLSQEVDQAISLIETLARHGAETATNDAPVARGWHGPAPGVLGAYRGALALDSPNYRLTSDVLRGLLDKLRATPKPTAEAAIKGAPTATYSPGPPRNPPRIVRRGSDTFARFPASATSARP
jgi:hypothetical protein